MRSAIDARIDVLLEAIAEETPVLSYYHLGGHPKPTINRHLKTDN
jgi:hypothetical protein